MIYHVSSHWSAETSRLHRRVYDTLEAALDAIGSHVTDDGWGDVDEDGHGCQAIGVYATEEDREANAEGGAPHRCLAVVREIRERREGDT